MGGDITIDGDEVKEITIDGEKVTEVTMDGDIIWTAFPPDADGYILLGHDYNDFWRTNDHHEGSVTWEGTRNGTDVVIVSGGDFWDEYGVIETVDPIDLTDYDDLNVYWWLDDDGMQSVVEIDIASDPDVIGSRGGEEIYYTPYGDFYEDTVNISEYSGEYYIGFRVHGPYYDYGQGTAIAYINYVQLL